MKIQEITACLEAWAPLTLQESYDNSGLLVGNSQAELNSILITLDCTEDVVDEAIKKNCNLIVAHHPILFKPIKSLTGRNYVERVLLKAIKYDIAIYALHTNLDNIRTGVNDRIARKIGLTDIKILEPKSGLLKKLITFVPHAFSEKVAAALHQAGAGKIGNYSECSFISDGVGSFRPHENARPSIGTIGQKESVHEHKLEVVYPAYIENFLLAALRLSHPYEVPAFDIISLDNKFTETGSGMIGSLPQAMNEKNFLNYLKNEMNLSLIRHSPFIGKEIGRVAICGGSGSSLLQAAKRENADVFISSDFKYHEFFDADNTILIADINHYEGEVFTKDLIYEYLIKKLSNIALVLSDVKTNPINYL